MLIRTEDTDGHVVADAVRSSIRRFDGSPPFFDAAFTPLPAGHADTASNVRNEPRSMYEEARC
ncbi:hypothetical protein [Micromonospora sp. NPDC050276]|uniref:hypothetical protein n=1 Tax=Micromonospora sp. NPDC050276 TaxID=3364278 RepID=UPI0037BBA721